MFFLVGMGRENTSNFNQNPFIGEVAMEAVMNHLIVWVWKRVFFLDGPCRGTLAVGFRKRVCTVPVSVR